MWEHLPPIIVHTRHPQCMHNFDHEGALARGIANRHSPLTTIGGLQRDHTAAYLAKHFSGIDAVYCSTYERTRAIPEAAKLSHCLIEDERLDERSMGVWHRHSRAEVLQKHPGEDKRLAETTYYHYQAPEGESCLHVEERLSSFLADKEKFRGCKVGYVSGHGISGLCLRKVLTGATVEDWHAYERLKNASVNIYQKFGDRYICALWNHAPWEGFVDPELLKRRSGEV